MECQIKIEQQQSTFVRSILNLCWSQLRQEWY